jgi:hypothetical protein
MLDDARVVLGLGAAGAPAAVVVEEDGAVGVDRAAASRWPALPAAPVVPPRPAPLAPAPPSQSLHGAQGKVPGAFQSIQSDCLSEPPEPTLIIPGGSAVCFKKAFMLATMRSVYSVLYEQCAVSATSEW